MQQAVMDELGVFLDGQLAELSETLNRLNALRAAVIRRDEAGLSLLLEQVQQKADRKRQSDAARHAVEQRLLETLDGLTMPVTLTRVCALIDDALRPPLRHRQAMLLEAAQRVQTELEATEMLLRECARCNRDLLGAILGQTRQSLTYDPQGQSQWAIHRGLVSMKL